MNDRCLFRAKRIDNGEWVEGYYTYYPSGFTSEDKIEHVIRDTITSVYCSNLYFVDPSTICQCTGLEDKNGKTIWENDILRYSYDYPDSPWLAAKGLTNDDIRYSIGAVFWQKWRGCWAVCCHSANYLEAFSSVYSEASSGSDSMMGILNCCCPAK